MRDTLTQAALKSSQEFCFDPNICYLKTNSSCFIQPGFIFTIFDFSNTLRVWDQFQPFSSNYKFSDDVTPNMTAFSETTNLTHYYFHTSI